MLVIDFINLICTSCGCMINTMSVVPPGAFAARKIRQNEDKYKRGYQTSDCVADLTPQKYSSKYMNSIWGMYNRYSVHNLKKNFDVAPVASTSQPSKEYNKSQTAATTTGSFLCLFGHL